MDRLEAMRAVRSVNRLLLLRPGAAGGGTGLLSSLTCVCVVQESMGRFSEAAAIYHELLEKNPLDAVREDCLSISQQSRTQLVAL